MSELKEYEVCIGRKLYQTIPPIVYVVADDNQSKLLNDKVYLKSEADKVIAELEMKLARAKLVLRLNTPEALYSNLEIISRLNHKIDVVERRELHQKYKRCLAMAKWSKAGMYLSYECDFKREWWNKWQKRWLELAERFKEADDA